MPWFSGVRRDEIDRGPSIDPDKRVSCSICLTCGKGVFAWEASKSRVERRDDCVAGCMTCANLCHGNAVTFPPVADLRKTSRDKGIRPAVPASALSAAPQPDGFTARTKPLMSCTPAGSGGAPHRLFSAEPS